ncbi:MAG: uracil permease [Gammaproteobacteria bacterium 39-13]|nr:uracil-xanthine permease [Gammaproteobacteria bacterium]OJV91141.1 MAG: uracil permease [Gammaproteobacteria bacterium 39-13]
MNKPIYPQDYSFKLSDCLLGAQTLFIAFGATVMVPLLTGMDPSVALLTAGLGTLIFQFLTKGQIPVFLGSSFAFVPATIYGIQTWGLPATLFGLAACGVVYFLMSLLVYVRSQEFVNRLFPTLITGPIIMNIGLVLAPVAINMAMGKTGDGKVVLIEEHTALIISGLALTATILTRLFGKGRVQLIPILVGIVVGYITSLWLGVVDFTKVQQATWFVMPNFTLPSVNWQAALLMIPIAAVSAIEHIGDVVAIGGITRRNYVRYPGLHRSLLGDGVATMVASSMGGPPSITYAEVTAGVAITKTYNPGIMTWASIVAILLAFVGKVGVFLQTIPSPVMGGVLILLFGAITVTGLHLLMQGQQDLMSPRNMTIVGIVLVIPVGGLTLGAGNFAISGIGLGGLIGVLLNLLLPEPNKESKTAALAS